MVSIRCSCSKLHVLLAGLSSLLLCLCEFLRYRVFLVASLLRTVISVPMSICKQAFPFPCVYY